MQMTDRQIILAATELLLSQPRLSLQIDPRELRYDRQIIFETIESYCCVTNQVRAELVTAGSPDGITLRHEALNIVIYNEKAPPSRRAFTLAHEVGHIYLDHSSDDRENERQANLFAAALLAPRVLVREISQVCGLSPAAVAKALGVSVQVIEIQLGALAVECDFLEPEIKLLVLSRGLLPRKNEPQLGW